MPETARPGERAGVPRRFSPSDSFRRRLALAAALLLGALWWAPAHGDGLYRCTGSGGETVFSSSPQGYHGCRRLASLDPPPPATRVPAVSKPARPLASFDAVRGSVESTATLVKRASAVPTGKPHGGWDYRESKEAPTDAAAGGGRVLRGAVYRVVRADGSVEYTNLQPPRGSGHAVTRLFTYIATCAACSLHSPIDWNTVRLNMTSYASAIHAASAESGVSEAFLRAIIHAESAFNPRALSLKGAQGLMQLMPATATEMGVRDAFDARQNIRGGARYLARLLTTFHGDERLAAAAYNAGPAAVARYDGVPPYDETRVYVQRVGVLRQRYDQAAGDRLTAMRGSTGAP